MNLETSWSAPADLALRHWRIYVARDQNDKGSLVAEADPQTRFYVIRNLPEGEHYVRVLAVNMSGMEEDWKVSQGNAKHIITRARTSTTPAALVSAGAAIVDSSAVAGIVTDAPASTGTKQKVEVIRGPDADRGQLVGTVDVERKGYAGDMGERTPVTVPVPMLPGRRTAGGNQTILIRGVSQDGKCPGTATSSSLPYLDMPNHYPTVIASISGATLTGISAPAADAKWEAVATDGAKLKAIPTTSAAAVTAAGWGDAESGPLYDEQTGAYYCTSATFSTDEYDLGAAYPFVLECYDEAQRKTAAGAFAVLDTRHAAYIAVPSADTIGVGTATAGVEWVMRVVDSEGHPQRPLPPTKWEVRWGTSPLSGDWLPYVPGMKLYGQYVQARVTLREPFGLHQLICPRLYVRVWRPMDTRIVTKTGGDFTAGELQDVTVDGVAKELGIRTDVPSRSIQANIGGSLVELTDDLSPHPNGIADATKFTVSYAAATRVFSVEIASGAAYWSRGQKYSPTADTITCAAHADATGIYWVRYSGATLAVTTSPDLTIDAPLAYAFFATDGTDRAVLFDERHPATWDPYLWRNQHQTRGAQLISGGTISDYVLDSNVTSEKQFSISSTVIEDESYRHTITGLTAAGPYTVWYRTGADANASWNWDTTPVSPFLDDGDDPYYNQLSGATWATTAIAANSNWVNYYLCATNAYNDGGTAHYKHRFILIMGQAVHGTLASARGESLLGSISWGTLPFAEVVPLYKVVYRRVSDGTYKNVQIDEVQRIVGTSVTAITTVTPTTHGALSGRSDPDQHPQSSISLNPTPADGSWDGCSSVMTVDANATGVGAALCLGADGNFDEADASAETTAPCVALALEAGTGEKRVLWWGTITKAAWNWTIGPGNAGRIYLSLTTGAMTQTAPSSSGEVVQVVGFAVTADTMFFRPDLAYSVVPA